MKSMHHAVCLIHVLGLNPMSVIAVQVRTDSKHPKQFLPYIISSVYVTLYETVHR